MEESNALIDVLEKIATPNILKDSLEILYYVAFIILTILMVVYARKTYLFQSKQDSRLFCKLYVPPADFGKVTQFVCLEIYNDGTAVAKSIQVGLYGRELALIDFIKPNESISLPIGELGMMVGCNRIWIQANEISEKEVLPITLTTNGESTTHMISTSALFVRSNALHNEQESIAESLKDINRTFARAFDCHNVGPGHLTFRDELCAIAESIKQAKK